MDALSTLMQAGLGRLALATLQSLPLAALVWALCRWLPRLGANARCWLWWLVSLQLVVGLCWPHPLRLPLLPAPDVQMAIVAPQAMPAAPLDMAAARAPIDAPAFSEAPSGIAVPAPTPVTGSAPAWMAWALWLAWLAGVAAMALRSLADLRITRQRVAASSNQLPAALSAQYRELTARLGLRRAPPLRLSDQLDSPQLAGVLSPCLLMPAHLLAGMSPAAIEMALHHELVHWQRRDLWWGWVPALAQHLFFFHPLAHVAAREYGLAREAACDAAVLTDDRHAPQDYGRLLLQFGVAPRAVAVVAAASPNFVLLKRRLTMLQSRSAPWRAGAFLLVAAVAVVGVMPYRVVAADTEIDAAERANLAAGQAPSAKPVAAPKPAVSAQPAAAPKAAAKAMPAQQAAPVAKVVPAVTAAGSLPALPAPPRAPGAPTAPVAPMAPLAPRAVPPVPPVPPAPTRPVRGTFSFLDDGDARTAWVLIEDGNVHAFGTPEDLSDARRQQRGDEKLWWFRDGNRRYVVRDAATLARLGEAYGPLEVLSEQQGKLGEQQGELGRQQGELGARQGELGGRQGLLAARVAQLALERSAAAMAGKQVSAAAQQQVEREQQALDKQVKALAAEQAALGVKQGELGKRQQAVGARQSAALEQLRAQGERLAREAVASGKAVQL